MARIGGRSTGMSWVAGVLCAAVIVGLLWLALPIVPVLAQVAGDALRSALP